MFCQNCGTTLRDGAGFCPECGLTTKNTTPPPTAEYSYETLKNLFPLGSIIALLIMFLFFFGLGLAIASGTGFWFVPLIMGGIVLISVFIAMLANKGNKKKLGVDRTLWILTPEGYGTGYPPDVAKRVAGIGAAGAAGGAKIGNMGIAYMGANMAARNFKTVINGLPIMPWTEFISAEYRPEKRDIALYLSNGQVGIIKTNPDNYAYVEQLIRGYMGVR